jgi:hypothetical protein
MPTLTLKVFRSCIPKLRTHIMVNSVLASCCCMTMPISMWPIECTTNWMPYNGRCSNILHIAQTYCYMTLKFWTVKASCQRLYIHVGHWCAGGCGSVVKAVTYWIPCRWDLVYQWDSCLEAYGDFFCYNTFTHMDPWMGFSYMYLIKYWWIWTQMDLHYLNEIKGFQVGCMGFT